jgi:hypothetical protein
MLSDTVGSVCVDVTVLDVLMILLYVEPTWKHVGSGFVGGGGKGKGEGGEASSSLSPEKFSKSPP